MISIMIMNNASDVAFLFWPPTWKTGKGVFFAHSPEGIKSYADEYSQGVLLDTVFVHTRLRAVGEIKGVVH